MTPVEIATIASTVFAGLSASLAAAAIYFPSRASNDKEILRQAILTLERAHRSLMGQSQPNEYPEPDRLNWLTCARHLQSYKGLKAQLKLELHRTLCDEHEEFWRHQFYLCLHTPSTPPVNYYQEKASPNKKIGIEPRSALVIHAFATWPDGRADSIDLVDVHALMQDKSLPQRIGGLYEYLQQFPKFKNET